MSNTPLYPCLIPNVGEEPRYILACIGIFCINYYVIHPSSGTEEITINPDSQWFPVPVKLDIKEEGMYLSVKSV